MDVWLGDFDELEAKELSRILESSGIRNEVRTTLEVDLDWYYYAEGRFSELKRKYADFKEVFEEWDTYIDAIRKNLVEGIDIRDFEEKVLDSIFPERNKVPSINELIEKKISILIRNILRLNGISFENGKIKGKLPDDPQLRVYMDIDDELAEKLKLESEFTLSVEKANQVYVNLIDAIKKIDELKKLCEERSELFELLLTANSVLKMLEKINKGKKVEELIAETSSIKLESMEVNLSKDAIEYILEELKKEGVVEIKRGKISQTLVGKLEKS